MHLTSRVPILVIGIIFLQGYDCSKRPNIIFIYADDLGMNDLSITGSLLNLTPNIDALGLNGVILHNYYGEWYCTPSRGALLSGMYPIRLGLQHYIIKAGEASGLPLNFSILPQHLKTLGYKTHMVGKWNIGYQNKQFLPTSRGFESFLGFYNGHIDYFDHTTMQTNLDPKRGFFFGLDFHKGTEQNGTKVLRGMQGRYATHIYTETAEEVIRKHNTSKPLFLYLAHQAVHAGNIAHPNEAPAEVISKFKYIKDLNRRSYAGKLSVMDDGVGSVFKALHQKDMLKNSIVVFASDNGAEIDPKLGGFGSNSPLRGKKGTQWEGGIRLPAFIWSPLLNLMQPRIRHQVMHVTDWLPTLYRAAGGDPRDLGAIDGKDLWKAVLEDSPSPRLDMLQNLDPISGTSAYRLGDMKLVNGSSGTGYDFWHGYEEPENMDGVPVFDRILKNGSVVEDVLKEMGMWIADNPSGTYQDLKIKCQIPPPKEAYSSCQPKEKPCLFNITADPCEYKNIADKHQDMVTEMMKKICSYRAESMKPQTKPADLRSDPLCHDFAYLPWLDPEHYTDCDYSEGGSYNRKYDI